MESKDAHEPGCATRFVRGLCNCAVGADGTFVVGELGDESPNLAPVVRSLRDEVRDWRRELFELLGFVNYKNSLGEHPVSVVVSRDVLVRLLDSSSFARELLKSKVRFWRGADGVVHVEGRDP